MTGGGRRGRHDPYLSVDLAERQRAVFPSAQVVVPFLRAHVST